MNPRVTEDPQLQRQQARDLKKQQQLEKLQKKEQQLKATENTGRAMEAGGQAAEIAGQGIQQVGREMQESGTALSKTGAGAVVGLPLAAAGGLTKAGGKAVEKGGRATKKAGKRKKDRAQAARSSLGFQRDEAPALTPSSVKNDLKRSLKEAKDLAKAASALKSGDLAAIASAAKGLMENRLFYRIVCYLLAITGVGLPLAVAIMTFQLIFSGIEGTDWQGIGQAFGFKKGSPPPLMLIDFLVYLVFCLISFLISIIIISAAQGFYELSQMSPLEIVGLAVKTVAKTVWGFAKGLVKSLVTGNK